MLLARTATAPRRRRSAPARAGQTPVVPQRAPLRHITNHLVNGDELFQAVVFLGAALALPALLPDDDLFVDDVGDDDDDLDDDTGEYAVVLPVLSGRRAA